MRFPGAKYAKNASAAGAPCRTSLGELTALPHPLAGFKRPTSKGRAGQGRGGDGTGREIKVA